MALRNLKFRGNRTPKQPVCGHWTAPGIWTRRWIDNAEPADGAACIRQPRAISFQLQSHPHPHSVLPEAVDHPPDASVASVSTGPGRKHLNLNLRRNGRCFHLGVATPTAPWRGWADAAHAFPASQSGSKNLDSRCSTPQLENALVRAHLQPGNRRSQGLEGNLERPERIKKTLGGYLQRSAQTGENAPSGEYLPSTLFLPAPPRLDRNDEGLQLSLSGVPSSSST